VAEANKLGIPVVAIVDTNCDPDTIDYVVPGNDDAIRAIKLFCTSISEACIEGKTLRDERLMAREEEVEVIVDDGKMPIVERVGEGDDSADSAAKPEAYISEKLGVQIILQPVSKINGDFIMAQISAAMVKELREKTGAGIMDCKGALKEKDGNLEEALVYLREKGLASASKKGGRITSEGVVASYIHAGGKIGVMVEVNCETDFVARTDGFIDFVKDIAMHIAAAAPVALAREDVAPEVLETERGIFRTQALDSGKPEKIVDKIVADFKSGKESRAPFWINMGGQMIHIEYFALRNDKGEYLGTLEVSHNVNVYRELKGEQRILSYK
jgi:elongation factor Ts